VNESSYIRSIHRHLPVDIYRWKINDRFTAGIADAYYSGQTADLWVEYKYEKKPPKTIKPNLSERQRHWLNSRLAQGRKVFVILGTPKGGYILEKGAWNAPVAAEKLTARPTKDIAMWIKAQTQNCAQAESTIKG
jgi:hypothetical protein